MLRPYYIFTDSIFKLNHLSVQSLLVALSSEAQYSQLAAEHLIVYSQLAVIVEFAERSDRRLRMGTVIGSFSYVSYLVPSAI